MNPFIIGFSESSQNNELAWDEELSCQYYHQYYIIKSTNGISFDGIGRSGGSSSNTKQLLDNESLQFYLVSGKAYHMTHLIYCCHLYWCHFFNHKSILQTLVYITNMILKYYIANNYNWNILFLVLIILQLMICSSL